MNRSVPYHSVPFFIEMLNIRCKIKTDISGYILTISIPSFISDAKCCFIEWFIKEIIPKKYINVEVKRDLWFNWPKRVSTKDMRKQSGCIKVKK